MAIYDWGKKQYVNSGNTRKVSATQPSNIVQWETDERTPFWFNDAGNQPHEGYLNVTPLMQLLSKATKRILAVRQQLELFQDPQ